MHDIFALSLCLCLQDLFQSERLRCKQACIHQRNLLRDDRLEFHIRKDILLNVNARCNLRQLQALIGYLEYAALGSELHLYSMRIREGRSHNTRGNGGNQWLHPDIVAMEPVDKAWGKHVKACGHASGSTCVRLWSFEVKKTLTVANIRKCFFQAVSNSSWAHEGYLVATAIADDRVEQELRMLSALHGIGVILLDPENPSESEILLPAQKKPDADWQSIDRLAKENGDFHEFIELVSVYFQTGTLREKDWDNKTA